MEAEKANTNINRDSELKEIQEIIYLEGQASKGELDADGEKKLRETRGVFYTFRFNGEQILVNHCLISKLVMGVFILGAVASIIYVAMFVEPIQVARSM